MFPPRSVPLRQLGSSAKMLLEAKKKHARLTQQQARQAIRQTQVEGRRAGKEGERGLARGVGSRRRICLSCIIPTWLSGRIDSFSCTSSPAWRYSCATSPRFPGKARRTLQCTTTVLEAEISVRTRKAMPTCHRGPPLSHVQVEPLPWLENEAIGCIGY
ncbi:hypothetical protein K469DRAFT_138123 [Zopfia rhizophila CBS 207.26]|uniref:Uncharacterized protein n=1 Tax=Zopfia rhizophila CBS 207.26 TaxID=1314779 RepID=A0A6A6E6P5_9PEZI|nr:hypothetical protein K469DRAFT_138123 [Zopfia rhizophila CBS 207.26]